MRQDPVSFLKILAEKAVQAGDPHRVVPESLAQLLATPNNIFAHKKHIRILGAGKASAAMAQAAEKFLRNHFSDHKIDANLTIDGCVVTRYDYAVPTEQVKIIEAAHPVPDAAGQAAAQEILALAQASHEDMVLLMLISGGGSALLSMPAPCLSLEEKQAINRSLLASGAPIHEINIVRKQLSAIKGGRLAQAASKAAGIHTLIISDVPRDDPSIVASGPTLPDHGTQEQAWSILQKYNIPVSPQIQAWLADPANETPKSIQGGENRNCVDIIARNKDALEAAAIYAREQDITPVILGDDIEGEARDVATSHALLAKNYEGKRPSVILSGGETSVTLKGTGKGGRNSEYMLAMVAALQGQDNIYGLAIDTDGIDGSENNAGAYFTPLNLKQNGLQPYPYLANNDSYSYFSQLDQLVETGPTMTNINDFRAILIL